MRSAPRTLTRTASGSWGKKAPRRISSGFPSFRIFPRRRISTSSCYPSRGSSLAGRRCRHTARLCVRRGSATRPTQRRSAPRSRGRRAAEGQRGIEARMDTFGDLSRAKRATTLLLPEALSASPSDSALASSYSAALAPSRDRMARKSRHQGMRSLPNESSSRRMCMHDNWVGKYCVCQSLPMIPMTM